MRRVIVSDSLIGDRLMQQPALRALHRAHPDDEIVLHVPRTDPNPSVQGSELLMQCLPYIHRIFVGNGTEQLGADQHYTLDPMAAYIHACQTGQTLSQGFGPQLGVEVPDDDLDYNYAMTPEEDAAGLAQCEALGGAHRVVVIARHSASCASNDPTVGVANKCIRNAIWVRIAYWLQSLGYVPVAVGSEREQCDERYAEWPGAKLYGLPIRHIASVLYHCAGTLTIDTGIRHLAAAVGGNMGCISCAIPLEVIRCEGSLPWQIIHERFVPIGAVNEQHIKDIAEVVLDL